MARNIKLGQGQFVYNDDIGNPIIISGDLGNGKTGFLLQDDNGQPVAELGKQVDGSVNLKFFDANGVGVAQMGRFSDGTTAIKVADSGVEVSTASNDKLIFNSNQDTFKIVSTVTVNLNVTASGGAGGFGQTTKAHGLSFTPAYIAFITLDPTIGALSAGGSDNLMTPAMTYGTVAGAVTIISISAVSVDATNVIFNTQLGNLVANGVYAFSAKVYLLQETFS